MSMQTPIEMSKIEKTIARQKQKIDEGQFYEAHQQLRVIASRYVKQENWDAATEFLASGAQLLLKAGQGGSGGDLCMFLMEVYNKSEMTPDAAAKGRLLTLLRAFPKSEPTKKRFVGEMLAWSSKYGEFPAGDPELHHVAGQLYAEEGEPYEAERHLTLGTKDSAQHLARMEYDWYESDASHTAGLYIARAVFPLLLVGNLRAASQALLLFTSRLSQSNKSLAMQSVSSASSDVRIYPSMPLLNFISLLLLAIERGNAELFRLLKSHYAAYIQEVGSWDEPLEQIAESYFGIRKPRQSNPLFDMMGSMFGGGGGGGGTKPAPKPAQKKVEAPAPAPAVD